MWPGSHLANPIQQPCHHLESASFDIRHHKAIKIKSDHSSPTSPCCLILIAVSTYKYQSRFPVSISNISRNSQFCGDVSLQKGIQKWWLSNNQMEPWQRPRRRHPTAALLHCYSHVIRLAGPLQIKPMRREPVHSSAAGSRFTLAWKEWMPELRKPVHAWSGITWCNQTTKQHFLQLLGGYFLRRCVFPKSDPKAWWSFYTWRKT